MAAGLELSSRRDDSLPSSTVLKAVKKNEDETKERRAEEEELSQDERPSKETGVGVEGKVESSGKEKDLSFSRLWKRIIYQKVRIKGSPRLLVLPSREFSYLLLPSSSPTVISLLPSFLLPLTRGSKERRGKVKLFA